MSVIQEKIYIGANSTGATLTFGLSGGVNISGYQQEINDITEEKKQESINPIEDYEITRFKYGGGTNRLSFYFLKPSNSGHNALYSNAGFSNSEISDKANVFRNSFFILDFYDTYSANTQTRLFTNYQTKLSSTPLFQFDSNQYYEMSYCNVPNWFLETQTNNRITAYLKISFYNAKDGELLLFYNKSINDIYDPKNLYFTVYFYPQTRTWKFIKDEDAYELTPNSAYVERNNETFQNFENKKQDYPDGNVFEDDGSYNNNDGPIGGSSSSSTSSSSSSSSSGGGGGGSTGGGSGQFDEFESAD